MEEEHFKGKEATEVRESARPQIDELHVGIIGAGRIGRTIAETLLVCGGIKAEFIHVSTRRPELLGVFEWSLTS